MGDGVLAAPCERDRLIVELFLATGIRLEELTNLTVDDMQEAADGVLLHVQGKGRKDRVVPVDTPNKPLSRRLKRYISHGRPRSSDRSLFLTLSRVGGEHHGLTRRGTQEILRRLARTTGLEVHAHRFRHTFATRAIHAGVNPLILQRVLGHTSQRMTSRYVHLLGEDVLREWAGRRD
ncbi:MAG: tyrosine-type recombinase/integrase [Candidatus Dormibacteria bacterium]